MLLELASEELRATATSVPDRVKCAESLHGLAGSPAFQMTSAVCLDAPATLCLASSDSLRRELYYRSMKRVLRSLMLLLFLHLAVGGTDLACANHSGEPAASQPVATMVDHHAGHPAESRQHHHQGDTAPISQPCCSAMASCSLTIATLRADGTEGIASRREPPTSRDLTALSWASTPDTPPPRA